MEDRGAARTEHGRADRRCSERWCSRCWSAAGFLLLGGGESYEVRARFQAATQIVKGNLVQVGGRKVGTVEEIELTARRPGRADAEDRRPRLHAAARRHPGHGGDRVAVRRRQPVRRPAHPAGQPGAKEDTIDERRAHPAVATRPRPSTSTSSSTLFDKETRKGLQDFIRGNARLYHGRGRRGQRRLAVPQPLARRRLAPVPRAQPRHPRSSRSSSSTNSQPRHRPRRPPTTDLRAPRRPPRRPPPARSPARSRTCRARSPSCRRSCAGRTRRS